MTDHPRIRGEHPSNPLRSLRGAGSSPHTRGARGPSWRSGRGRGIIPAYAGSTSFRRRARRSLADHPRIRGEHRGRNQGCRYEDGSSPHTRGARPCRSCRAPTGTDHPRIRGEHFAIARFAATHQGSSPHTRGARPELRHSGVPYPDHPRIRGEHPARGGDESSRGGSSPHTRGAPRRSKWSSSGRRIIPAYAGSTAPSRPRPRRSWDHPRIRGEHGNLEVVVYPVQGSSPHTRGARGVGSVVAARRRIIPAYAGSTTRAPSLPSSETDHPRIRGEHVVTEDDAGVESGSSPHTRGAPNPPQLHRRHPRIIPAYAGSTA